MNSLVFLPLMAAMVIAAPGGIVSQFPGSTGPLVAAPVIAAPAVAVRAVQPVVHAAPAVAHVSVPITKTIHYETRPVVTGYSSTIIKPAIPHFSAPVLQAVSVQQHVVAAPVVQQQVVAAPAPVAVAAPQQVVSTADAEIVEARSAAVPVAAHFGGFGFGYGAPAVVAAPAPVAVRAPQAGDFGPLVTKENILAPVRTHTQVIPQITQVQPEVTVRKVVHNVDVQTPVAVHSPVHVQVNQPIVAAAPAVYSAVAGHHFVGHAGQFVL